MQRSGANVCRISGRERLVDVLAREEDDRRLIVLEKVTAGRDKLAAELKAAYPPIEAQLSWSRRLQAAIS